MLHRWWWGVRGRLKHGRGRERAHTHTHTLCSHLLLPGTNATKYKMVLQSHSTSIHNRSSLAKPHCIKHTSHLWICYLTDIKTAHVLCELFSAQSSKVLLVVGLRCRKVCSSLLQSSLQNDKCIKIYKSCIHVNHMGL